MRKRLSKSMLAISLIVFPVLFSCATKDASLHGRQLWTTEAAAARAGPKPTDHESLIRSWLKTSLQVSSEEQVDIGPAEVSMYSEKEGGREKVWWSWGSTVRVQRPAREQGKATAAVMMCTVFIKEGRVVFALFPNGSAITAEGIRIPPGARIPGLVQ